MHTRRAEALNAAHLSLSSPLLFSIVLANLLPSDNYNTSVHSDSAGLLGPAWHVEETLTVDI